MYAIVQTGGKQVKVQPGDTVTVEKIDGDSGADIAFNQVLMVADPESNSVTIGKPFIEGAKVCAEIKRQVKGNKIIVFKSKRRQGYHKKQGHRQLLTEVTIKDITVQ
jgi:large subunit ribosomal protein L21